MRPGTCSFLQANLRLEPVALATRLAPGTTGVSSPAPVAAGFVGIRNARRQYRGLAFDRAAFRVLIRVLLASVPYRNNPVTGGVLPTSAAGETPAGLDLWPEPPEPPPEQMARVPGFLGDGEVTSW